MEFISNSVVSIGDALRLFDGAISFIVQLVGYLPAVLGTAVVVYLATYIIRFFLLK